MNSEGLQRSEEIEEVTATLIHGVVDAARQLEDEVGWRATALGELRTGVYCLVRSLYDLLPVLSWDDSEAERAEVLADEAVRGACRDLLVSLEAAGVRATPELMGSVEDVLRGAIAGLVANAVLIYGHELRSADPQLVSAVLACSLPPCSETRGDAGCHDEDEAS